MLLDLNTILKKKSKIVILIAVSLFICTGMFVYGFLNIGNWLIVSSPQPQKADIIFVFSGDYKRIIYALELTKKYPNAIVLCSKNDAEYVKMKFSNSAANIKLEPGNTCLSTLDEIHSLRLYLAALSPTNVSVVLVSSPFHMRRISIMNSKNAFTNATFFYTPIPHDSFGLKLSDYRNWWNNKTLRRQIKSEWIKLAYYLVSGS